MKIVVVFFRMPLFVKAKAGGLTRADLHAMLSSHYEGSWLDPSLDVGAGPEHSPYRWNGLSWVGPDDETYVNERVVGTQVSSNTHTRYFFFWLFFIF
jgi:dipeptidase